MHLKIPKRKGLDLPLAGAPTGEIQTLPPSDLIALHLGRFDDLKFKVLVKVDDPIRIGQPLAYDKGCPERQFVSPVGGTLREVRRGPKRRLLSFVIERDEQEERETASPFDISNASREQLVAHLAQKGLFAHIRMRPFNLLANPKQTPRSVFVKAVETAPFTPPADYQVQGHEDAFQVGLSALTKLTDGHVHLVHRAGSFCKAFTEAQGVEIHTVTGPHPAANSSVHIHMIDPIVHPDQLVWTVNAHDVVCIGKMLLLGHYHNERVVGIGGPGIRPDQRGFFRVRTGHAVRELLKGRRARGKLRYIAGDPLVGEKTEESDFLRFHDFVLTVLEEPRKRQFLHFLRLGLKKFSIHRAYLSGQIRGKRQYAMTTNNHGEERAFIDCAVYDRVMPMKIPTALLVKAILAEDYDHAEMVGVLEVAAEDFALPTLVCPSKVEMVQIVREGLRSFAEDLLS